MGLIYINGLLIVVTDFSEVELSNENTFAFGRILCMPYKGCIQNFPIFQRYKTIVCVKIVRSGWDIIELFIHETLHPILIKILFEDGLYDNSQEKEHFVIRELLKN